MEKELLPKWIMKRYLVLWEVLSKRKEENSFTFDTAASILLAELNDNRGVVGLVLSALRKAGWLEVNLDTKDNRRRIYKIANFKDVFKEYVAEAQKMREEKSK